VILDDPFDDPPGLESHIPECSPEPTREQLDVCIVGCVLLELIKFKAHVLCSDVDSLIFSHWLDLYVMLGSESSFVKEQ
jgi:hypothetical protein